MSNVLDPNVISSLREARKRAAKHDCQGERRAVPLGGYTHRMFEAAAADVDAKRQDANEFWISQATAQYEAAVKGLKAHASKAYLRELLLQTLEECRS